jgi:hypothetical protein
MIKSAVELKEQQHKQEMEELREEMNQQMNALTE